jgi:[ribosomal protein S5]-alanine N-acetyltransferase
MRLVGIQRDGALGRTDIVVHEPASSAIAATLQMYERRGYIEPWIGYLAVEGGVVVGTCAFTSPPVSETVEIAYFTFPQFEGHGVATRMARRLMSMARKSDRNCG